MTRSTIGCVVASLALTMSVGALTVASDDTAVTVDVRDGQMLLTSLVSKSGGYEWITSPIPVPFIDAVETDGQRRAVHWQPGDATANSLRFTSTDPPLELISQWSAAPGPGPIEHRLTLRNRGDRPVLIPVPVSLAFNAKSPKSHKLQQWWVDKGAGTPTPDGTHHQPLAKNLLRCWPSGRDNPRDPIPWTSVVDAAANQGWYAGVQYTARVRLATEPTPESESVRVTLGLMEDDKVPVFARLAPGESFEAPPVFVGCFAGDVDDGSNRLRRWTRAHVVPPTRDARYPLLVNNSWGGGMAVDESVCRRMIDESAALGLEMFHIDAGWFRGVGDWRPDERKFPNGLAPIADYAHAKGLKFGLWVGWTQGGIAVDPTGRHAILSVRDPAMTSWFNTNYPPDWKPGDFTGATACLAEPKMVDWSLATLRPLIKGAKLDLLEHDQTMVVDNCDQPAGHAHTRSRVDIGYAAATGYYQVYDALRADFPDLLFENCVNGGHMVDYGALRRCHYISITDTYDPLSNRRAFYDASYALPPAVCECYVENVPFRSLAHLRYVLRSGMMGWCTIMTDTSKWTPEQHEAARQLFAAYKDHLRPLIRAADLYHVSDRPDGVDWDGIEYHDPQTGRGALFAFRGKAGGAEHTFKLKGLDPAARYALTFEDGSAAATTLNGAELAAGLTIHLPEPETSEVVLLSRR